MQQLGLDHNGLTGESPWQLGNLGADSERSIRVTLDCQAAGACWT